MISGAKWMLMWRSGPCSSEAMALVSHVMRLVVVSVGRLRPPYVDDVQHYKKLLAPHARLALIDGGSASAPTLERPKRADFGDYSTNAALLLAPVLRAPPRDVAARLSEELRGRLADRLERVEVAGPGFLNLWLGDEWFRDALRAVLAAGEAFGG